MFEEKAFIIQIPDILLFVMLVWKNLEDLQLATTGVVGGGGCWWPCLFQVLTLTFSGKKIRTEKLWEHASQIWHVPLKKNIHVFGQSALKMLMPQFEKMMFKRIGIHPLQRESYPSVDPMPPSLQGQASATSWQFQHVMFAQSVSKGSIDWSIPTGCGVEFCVSKCHSLRQLDFFGNPWLLPVSKLWRAPGFNGGDCSINCTGESFFTDFLVSCGKEWVRLT